MKEDRPQMALRAASSSDEDKASTDLLSAPGTSAQANSQVAVDIARIASIEKTWDAKGNARTIEVSLKSYRDRPYLDCRLYVESVSRDEMVPTAKGITIGIRQLPQFVRAIRNAYRQAEALGLMQEQSS